MTGPYYAYQIIAEMITNLIDDTYGLGQLMNKGDKFFVDGKFRDAKDVLKSEGFKVLMPFLKSVSENSYQLKNETSLVL